MLQLTTTHYVLIALAVVIIAFLAYRYFSSKETYVNNDSDDKMTSNNDPSSSDDSYMKNSKKRVILFYSPSCSHCHNFMDGENSSWNQLISKNKDNIDFSEINCDESPEIATNYEVKKYPTIILLLPSGNKLEYDGNRSVDDLETFIYSNQ